MTGGAADMSLTDLQTVIATLAVELVTGAA